MDQIEGTNSISNEKGRIDRIISDSRDDVCREYTYKREDVCRQWYLRQNTPINYNLSFISDNPAT